MKRWDVEAGCLGLKIPRYTRVSRIAALLHPSAHPRPSHPGEALGSWASAGPGPDACATRSRQLLWKGCSLWPALWGHSSSKNQSSLLIKLLPLPLWKGH